MGTGHAGSPSCGRGKGAEHLCLDCMDAQKRQRTPSPPISTGVCLESEGPPLCPSRPRGPSVHDSSMKPREHEELHYGDASLNPSSASCNRKKQSPEPLAPVRQGSPVVKKINLDAALACSRGPCWAVGAAPSCTPNLRSELCAGGSRPQTRWGLRGLGLRHRPAWPHPSRFTAADPTAGRQPGPLF